MSDWHKTTVHVFEDLLGKTITGVVFNGGEITFKFGGTHYVMHHVLDGLEEVKLSDISGDVYSLIGNPLLKAEKVSEEGVMYGGTFTWTFFKFATIKGDITICWYGESNGYYSEDVDFEEVKMQ